MRGYAHAHAHGAVGGADGTGLIGKSYHRGVRFTPAGAAARLAGDQRVVRGGDGTGNRTGKKGEKKRLPILST